MLIQEISLEQVWKIRHEVFWPDRIFDFIKLENDSEGIHLGLFDDELISVVSLFYQGNAMQFRKLATLDEFQGRGYGSHLMKEVLKKAKNEGMHRLWCNARSSKKHFYEKLGLREIGQYYVKDGIDFTLMEIQFRER